MALVTVTCYSCGGTGYYDGARKCRRCRGSGERRLLIKDTETDRYGIVREKGFAKWRAREERENQARQKAYELHKQQERRQLFKDNLKKDFERVKKTVHGLTKAGQREARREDYRRRNPGDRAVCSTCGWFYVVGSTSCACM